MQSGGFKTDHFGWFTITHGKDSMTSIWALYNIVQYLRCFPDNYSISYRNEFQNI